MWLEDGGSKEKGLSHTVSNKVDDVQRTREAGLKQTDWPVTDNGPCGESIDPKWTL